MLFTAIVVAVLLAAGLIENALHQRRLREVPVRILVNGTRGKTSTARLIAAALNEAGIRTVCRTTGSEAVLVLPDGSTQEIVRRHGARITEFVGFTRTCVEQKAQCMVVECMALAEENQRTVSTSLIKPSHLVITNSYVDHVPEMGMTEEQTAWTLARTIIKGCKVFCTEDYYSEYCKQGGAEFVKVQMGDYEGRGLESGIPVHNQNFSLAVAVCSTLGVDENVVLAAASKAKADVGLLKTMRCQGGAILIPDFSVNDVHCMESSLCGAVSDNPGCNINVIYNNRSDREYRLLLIRKVLQGHGANVHRVYCVGSYPAKVQRYLKRAVDGFSCEVIAASDEKMLQTMNNASENEVFIGLGNIKGSGEALISGLSGGGVANA